MDTLSTTVHELKKDQKFILDIGEEDLSEEEKKRLYFEAGGDGTNPVDLPLFLD